MDERSACVKADPKRIREVFKRGERIKGISRSIEIRNRTRLARLLHAKIEGKQRRKVGGGEEKNENSTRDKVSLQKSSPPLCNHDRANIHRDRWIRIEMEILARFFRISWWVMEGSREGTGGRRGKSDDSIFANVTPRRFNFHTRKRWGREGWGHGYLRSNPSSMARRFHRLGRHRVKHGRGWKWAIVSRPGIRNTRLLNRKGEGTMKRRKWNKFSQSFRERIVAKMFMEIRVNINSRRVGIVSPPFLSIFGTIPNFRG